MTYYLVESPLSEPAVPEDAPEEWGDDEWWPIEYEEVLVPDPMVAVQRRMIIILLAAVVFLAGFGLIAAQSGRAGSAPEAAGAGQAVEQAADSPVQQPAVTGSIAPLFTREVQYWAPQIVSWAAQVGVDPNAAATIMQIESCGDPNAVSVAGAQGLFQVMPFHFTDGENMQDPDTNALKGLNYFADRLEQTGGDAGRAFAGYNGGHVAAGGSWDSWYPETQRYYTWSTGIYNDSLAGSATSATLDQWLAAGGAGLCRQAAERLGLE
jgi:soluble lytic murein transglycosylase-like protein